MKKKIFGFVLACALLIPNLSYAKEDVKSRILKEAVSVSDSFVINNRNVVSEKKKDTSSEDKKVLETAKPIPVLMFHEVGYMPNKEFADANYILKESLDNKVRYLSANGYTTVTMHDVYENWINGKELPEKPVVLSFDDGYASHFNIVVEILRRYNAVGTFYIVTDRLSMGIKDRNIDGVKKLVKYGMEIGGHSTTHPDFSKMTYDQIYNEVAANKDYLESSLGIDIKTFSFPFGNYNPAAIQVIKDLGFETVVTTKEGLGNPKQFKEDGQLKISRYNIYNSTTDGQFKMMIDGLK